MEAWSVHLRATSACGPVHAEAQAAPAAAADAKVDLSVLVTGTKVQVRRARCTMGRGILDVAVIRDRSVCVELGRGWLLPG